MTDTVYIEKPKTGVHWGWWVFWLIFFWPALIVVALIHFGRKDATNNVVSHIIQGDQDDAEIRKLKKEIEKKELRNKLEEMDQQ